MYEYDKIHILLRIPIAQTKLFKLYDTVSIPQVLQGEVTVLNQDLVKNHFAIDTPRLNYLNFDNDLDCFVSLNSTICPNAAILPVLNSSDCVLNYFLFGTDSYCNYDKQQDRLMFSNYTWDYGLVVFVLESIIVKIHCSYFEEELELGGSFVLEVPKNCYISSDYFFTLTLKTFYNP